MKNAFAFLLFTLAVVACRTDEVTPPNDPAGTTPSTYPTSILAGQEAGDGIHHVDFSPNQDLVVGPNNLYDSISIDMDGDQMDDFILAYRISDPYMLGAEYSMLDLVPLNGREICVDPGDPRLADSLLIGDLINDDRTWSDSVAVLHHYSHSQAGSTTHLGYFQNNTSHFIGVRLAGVDTLYGWLFLDHLALDEFGVTEPY